MNENEYRDIGRVYQKLCHPFYYENSRKEITTLNNFPKIQKHSNLIYFIKLVKEVHMFVRWIGRDCERKCIVFGIWGKRRLEIDFLIYKKRKFLTYTNKCVSLYYRNAGQNIAKSATITAHALEFILREPIQFQPINSNL